MQAWNPKLKFSHYDAPRCGIALVNHLSVVLEGDVKLEQHGWQELVTEVLEEGEVVQGNHFFHRFATVAWAPRAAAPSLRLPPAVHRLCTGCAPGE